MLPAEVPLYSGDVIEMQDPRGGMTRYRITDMQCCPIPTEDNPNNLVWEATLEEDNIAIIDPAELEAMGYGPGVENGEDGADNCISDSVQDLLLSGHYDEAVFRACAEFEKKVRKLTDLDATGTALMDAAFSPKNPKLKVSSRDDETGRNLQNGIHAIARGVFLAIRNPIAHGENLVKTYQEATELVGVVSYLCRQLDGVGS